MNDDFKDLETLIDSIKNCKPVTISKELRELARKAVESQKHAPKTDEEIEKWVAALAESVSGADD